MGSHSGKENHYLPLWQSSACSVTWDLCIRKQAEEIFLIRWIFQGVFHKESAAPGYVLHLLKDGVVLVKLMRM